LPPLDEDKQGENKQTGNEEKTLFLLSELVFVLFFEKKLGVVLFWERRDVSICATAKASRF